MTDEVIGKIHKRFTIVIPKEIRESIGLREGDSVRIQRRDNEIVIIPERSSFYDRCYQILGDIRYSELLEEEIDRLGVNLEKTLNLWEEKDNGDR